MCGIVGYIGKEKQGNGIVLEGLRRLEYRGYDSCGISYIKDDKIKTVKSVDRIQDLIKKITVESSISLGHTRWATHGGVNLENAHPHMTSDQKMVMVHNGVIENYEELKEKYCKNINLISETDTEIILETLNYFYKETENMHKAIEKLMEVVEGSYACIVLNKDFENKFYCLKNKSPMLIGRGKNYFTVSSDPRAVLDKVTDFYQIEDKNYVILNGDDLSIKVYDINGEEKSPKFEIIEMDFIEMKKKEYDTFMQKEIEEQPQVLRNIIDNYKNITLDSHLVKSIQESNKIYIVASGTSYHSGLIVKPFFEKYLKIPVEVVLGSEFGYSKNLILDKSFFVFLSQSGETADSLLVFNKIKGQYPILALTNTRGSQMDRNADFSLQLFAGQEIAVASTKAYTAQIATSIILINKIIGNDLIFDELEKVIIAQEKVLGDKEIFKKISEKFAIYSQAFYLGRLGDYALSQEAALKIKEVTYINVSAFATGELKHGTISLIDDDKLTVSLINDPNVELQSRSGNMEIEARGGEVLVFSNSLTQKEGDTYCLEYEGDLDLISLIAIIPHQYIAYYTALELNLDVDKPRNLAKSVTVE